MSYTSKPIGIPSGWEEITARNWTMKYSGCAPLPEQNIYREISQINWPYLIVPESEYDWRVGD